MRRGLRMPLAVAVCCIVGGGALGGCAMPRDERLPSILGSHPGMTDIVERAEHYRLQVVLGLVEEGTDGRPVLEQQVFRAGAEYFYPASTVKLFAAVGALETLAELRRRTGLAIDVDTPLVYHRLFDDEELDTKDPDNLEDGSITVRQQIREILLVSDNQAFNRLYELVGQDVLAGSLRRAGLMAPRVVHRLSEARSPEENRRAPAIDFVGPGLEYSLPERISEPLEPPVQVARIAVGQGYLTSDGQVAEPMDFTLKNHFPLADLQRGLCMVVRPDVDCGGDGFDLAESDRELLLEAMVQYPRESTNPRYAPDEYPDHYVKYLLPGLERVIPKEQLRIYNKVGQAYGFTTENAWVVNADRGEGFFLAATLYTNEDGILNDDEYEYEDVAQPFLADLGEALARALWADDGP